MYVADGPGGVLLQNLDGEDHALPPVSSHWSESLSVDRGLLFVAQGNAGIEIFYITDPGHPEPVAFWPHLKALRLTVAGDHLLTSKGVKGVELIDISDMQRPVIKDTLPDIHALDITSEGNLVYIASKDQGLLVYAISDNAEFIGLSRLSTPFPMNHFDLTVAVRVHDGIAYIANGRSGLLIVDVRDPAEPRILSSIDVPGTCKAIKIAENKAFISSHHGGINIVNIADPEQPIFLNSIAMSGLSRGLQVVDDLVYVAQKEMGVTVVPVPVMAETIDLLSRKQMQVVLPSPDFPGRYNLQINNQRDSAVSDGVVEYR